MSGALVPVYPGRPPWIRRDGIWIALSVHDAAYLQQRETLRRAILAASPAQRTRSVAALQNYTRNEARWYEAHGVEPPRHGLTPKKAPTRRRGRRRGIAHTACRHGHALTAENRYQDNKGTVRCRICMFAAPRRARALWAQVRHQRLHGRSIESLSESQFGLVMHAFGRWLAQQ